MADKPYLGLVFANADFIRAPFYQSLKQNLQNVYWRRSLTQSLLKGLPWWGPKKNFHNKNSQMAGKYCHEIDFCKFSVS